jgi:hypothetical protein
MEAKDICKWYNICLMKRYFEEGKLDIKWIDGCCKGNYHRCIRRKMEAEGKYHPDNMLPNGSINKKLKM